MKKTALFILFAISACFLSACTEAEVSEESFSHYVIDATFDEATRTVTATQRVQFINVYDVPVSEVVFRLYGNAYNGTDALSPTVRDEAYYNGESVGSISVGEVLVDGKKAHAHSSESGQAVYVALGKEVYPDEKAVIEFDFVLTIAEVVSRLGVGRRAVNLAHWYPELSVLIDGEWYDEDFASIGDPFITQSAVFDVTLTTDKDFVVASSGKLVSEEENGGLMTRRYEGKKVRDFALCISKDFNVVSALSGGTLISYYYLDDDQPTQTLSIAQNATTLFSDRFGSFPYPTLALVETELLYSGMEYGAMVLTDLALKDKTHAVVHEIAHQWWYGIAGNNGITHAFMDEGLAEWCTAYYLKTFGKKTEQKDLARAHERRYVLYLDVMANITGEVDAVMEKSLDEYLSEYEYEVISYSKGFLLFDNVCSLIGEESFLLGLKRYAQDARYKIADLSAMIASIETGSKKRCEGIFNAWVKGRVTYYLLGALE